MSKATGFETFKGVVRQIERCKPNQERDARELVSIYARMNQDKPKVIDLLKQCLSHKF